jgi:hypothetical protein
MDKSILNKLLTCSLLLWFAGCAENKYIQTTEQICVPAITKANAMAAAEQVLAGMHFAIEKLDVEAGCIKTYPLVGAQTFEFWRSDSIGPFNRAEADLHSIRRAVELNITEQAGQLCINCKATTQRLSLSRGQTAASQGHAIMSPGQRSIQNLKLDHSQKSNITWLDLGRDNQLETEIIKRIEKRLTAAKKEQNK